MLCTLFWFSEMFYLPPTAPEIIPHKRTFLALKLLEEIQQEIKVSTKAVRDYVLCSRIWGHFVLGQTFWNIRSEGATETAERVSLQRAGVSKWWRELWETFISQIHFIDPGPVRAELTVVGDWRRTSGSSHTCWHRRSPRHSLFRHSSETLYGDCFISVPVPPPGSWRPGRMTLIFWKQSVQYWSVGMSCLWHGLIYCAQEGSLFPVVPELIALTFTALSCHTPNASRGRIRREKDMQWTHLHCSLERRRKQRGRHVDHWKW